MPIFKGLVPGKDSQVFVLTTLENPPIYIFSQMEQRIFKTSARRFQVSVHFLPIHPLQL